MNWYLCSDINVFKFVYKSLILVKLLNTNCLKFIKKYINKICYNVFEHILFFRFKEGSLVLQKLSLLLNEL